MRFENFKTVFCIFIISLFGSGASNYAQQEIVEKAEAIHLMLHMIRLGNLLGNTWDYILFRVSFGRWRR